MRSYIWLTENNKQKKRRKKQEDLRMGVGTKRIIRGNVKQGVDRTKESLGEGEHRRL